LRDGLALPIILKENAVALVIALFLPCSPHTISSTIPDVIVLSFKGKRVVRGITHVTVEKLKASPIVTHRDPATSIVVIQFMVGVGTALDHAPPDAVAARLCLAVGDSFLPMQAST
jgi:hypothetical protein